MDFLYFPYVPRYALSNQGQENHCCGRWMDSGNLYNSWQTKLTSRPICIAQNRQFLHSFFKKLGIVFPERLPGTKSGRTSNISIDRNWLLKIILWPIWDKFQWPNLLSSKKDFTFVLSLTSRTWCHNFILQTPCYIFLWLMALIIPHCITRSPVPELAQAHIGCVSNFRYLIQITTRIFSDLYTYNRYHLLLRLCMWASVVVGPRLIITAAPGGWSINIPNAVNIGNRYVSVDQLTIKFLLK